jgi:hypothetical protein
MRPAKKQPNIPFAFALDYLTVAYDLRQMFGCFAVYTGGKITLILRKRKDHRSMNGIWLATRKEHHASLKKDFPSLRSIPLLGRDPTNWQMVPERAGDFEASVIRACELVSRRDPRIGRTPRKRS